MARLFIFLFILVGCSSSPISHTEVDFVDDFMLSLRNNQMTPESRFFSDGLYSDPIVFENDAFMNLLIPFLSDFEYEILNVTNDHNASTIFLKIQSYNFFGFLNHLSPDIDSLIQKAIDTNMTESEFNSSIETITKEHLSKVNKDLKVEVKMNLVKQDNIWFIVYDDDYLDLFLALTGHLFLEN